MSRDAAAEAAPAHCGAGVAMPAAAGATESKEGDMLASATLARASKRVSMLTRHVTGAATGAGAGHGIKPSPVSEDSSSTDGMKSLVRERAGATFNTRELTYFLDGSKRMTGFKEKAMAQLEADPVFRNDDRFDLDRGATRKRTMEKIRAMYRQFVSDSNMDHNLEMRQARLEMAALMDPSWMTRNGVHFGLFMGAVSGQGTEDQCKEWLPQIFMLNIFGCFGMTELGHGSFTRGVETIATYIPESQEFEIHSPTVTATKWWIGGAGQTATHCSVFARLIIGGDDKGVHCFIVRIRDSETHAPMPGVMVGDIGHKLGRNGIDNGFIRFDRVRIPREQMLAKHAQVSPEGVYTKPPKAQLAYGALLQGRSVMVKDSADTLKMALSIVVRYTAVRRQGQPFRSGLPEPQILDYQSMQARVLPCLASAYAFHFTAKYIMDLYDTFSTSSDEGEMMALLPDVHATSAGMKAYCTWYCLESIEKLRQCCGGHGYSSYAALGGLFEDFAVQCTWEGDNTVMSLQTARYLISSLRKLRAGETIAGSVRYLTEKHKPSWDAAGAGVLDPASQLAALRFQASGLVKEASEALETAKRSGMTETEAWNATSVLLLRASKCHVYLNICTMFSDAVTAREAEEAASTKVAEAGLGPVLRALSHLFTLQTISEGGSHFLSTGYLSAASLAAIDKTILTLYGKIRPNAVALVDAFNFSDFILNSPLGRYDGNVYEHYFEQVKKAPLCMTTAPYYASTMKPMFDGMDLMPAGSGDE